MLRRDGREILSFLATLVDGRVVVDAEVFDTETQLQVFGARLDRVSKAAEAQDLEAVLSGRKVTRSVGAAGLRTVVPIANQEACRECHAPERAILGALYLESSTLPTEADVTDLRRAFSSSARS